MASILVALHIGKKRRETVRNLMSFFCVSFRSSNLLALSTNPICVSYYVLIVYGGRAAHTQLQQQHQPTHRGNHKKTHRCRWLLLGRKQSQTHDTRGIFFARATRKVSVGSCRAHPHQNIYGDADSSQSISS